MKLKNQLESLAKDTWERLRDSRSLDIRFGEETITDLLLLEMKRKNHPRTDIVQTPLIEEKNKGTDWEWWIGSPRTGWLAWHSSGGCTLTLKHRAEPGALNH